jgi:secreted PhoX family phosphatase
MPPSGFDPRRRRLLQAAAAIPFVSLLQACSGGRGSGQATPAGSPYGPLQPVRDLSTGLPLLQLPAGFRYASFSWSGDVMADGQPVPARHDGMAVVAERVVGGERELVLVRNHENGLGHLIKASAQYDAVQLAGGQPAGGTTNLYFRPASRRWRATEASLGGTLVNCAGGVTPWGSWLSCEETAQDHSAAGGRRHGYVFEVGPEPAQTSAEPIIAMGRFRHEAVAVDPVSGSVYLTEDNRNKSALYRYLPADRTRALGALAGGGRLQAARVRGVANADLTAPALGDEYLLEWVDVAEPDADPAAFEAGQASGPFLQAWAQGALRMSRGEGIWYGDGRLYIVDTSAGRDSLTRSGRGNGCVWLLDLARMRLQAVFVSDAAVVANNPDNITLSPRGGVLLCEDGGGVSDAYGQGNRLLGLSGAGAYIFAKNNVVLSREEIAAAGKQAAAGDHRGSEFCGACFDSRGEVLFVNVQSPGITFAIWGPWELGPL